MPRVHKVTAKFDRYQIGSKIEDKRTKSGYRRDKSKPCPPEDLPSWMSEDEIFCPKGETYYWYKKRYGGRIEKREYPKPSELTSSEFLTSVYEIGETIPDFGSFQEIESWIEETKETLETVLEETDEKLNNLPEQLQYAPVGELLQNRVDSVQEWIDGLDTIELEPEQSEQDWKEEYREDYNDENGEIDEEDLQELWEEYLLSEVERAAEEIQTEYEGE